MELNAPSDSHRYSGGLSSLMRFTGTGVGLCISVSGHGWVILSACARVWSSLVVVLVSLVIVAMVSLVLGGRWYKARLGLACLTAGAHRVSALAVGLAGGWLHMARVGYLWVYWGGMVDI